MTLLSFRIKDYLSRYVRNDRFVISRFTVRVRVRAPNKANVYLSILNCANQNIGNKEHTEQITIGEGVPYQTKRVVAYLEMFFNYVN